ncbi:transcription initiation factor TFIIF subunit beta [Nematocida homosporus]|uniref:transcription initiation factor TFIIF subunit beta n=1 Tax=Nematocida homosporus TaxID=1912981 RepID=UPI00222051B5|nr:transcription initiation factor TFIIF subunit beta [Nematocida homosporus]KAI5184596.1 transcription initiation factor TFIIF subunit beta [Nematocida homosporus]
MGERRHTKVTLVKVPRVLAECLERYESGTEVGAIEETANGVVFRVCAGIGPSGLPREWHMDTRVRQPGMFTFVQRSQSATIDGIVAEEATIRPEITPEYLRYKKERAKALEVRREVKAVDSLREGIRMEKYGASEYDLMARRRKKMLLDKKRERLAKTEVMDIMFRAFEEYPYWSLKDLADRSGQPQAYIQEILPEIAVMNKKTHKNMYELKPEYKNN